MCSVLQNVSWSLSAPGKQNSAGQQCSFVPTEKASLLLAEIKGTTASPLLQRQL